MTYTDCQKIVDATKHLIENTNYKIEFYLDGEIYFTLNGKVVDYDKLPENIRNSIHEIVEKLEIEY